MGESPAPLYRGRLAPSPTGLLHVGHAQTFWIAAQRAKAANGALILRIEDLDRERSRPEFVAALIEDLKWLGIQWDEGPFFQSERTELYRAALERLQAGGFVYPCVCSRRDVQSAGQAPHAADDELIYPGTCRERRVPPIDNKNFSWRFWVRDGEEISFFDATRGLQTFVAGRDFGDFVVWSRRSGNETPAYQLAVVVDDAAMGITEVVRGEDLLVSTARQLLVYRALGLTPPAFCHCPLVTNDAGARLAKRDDAFTLRAFRDRGWAAGELLQAFTPSPLTPTSPRSWSPSP